MTASSRHILEEIGRLFAISKPLGYPVAAVEAARGKMGGMPKLLEDLYLGLGLSAELQTMQDTLILPDKYPVFLDYDYLVFFNENQGVCQAGIHKNDLLAPDPPVYVGYDNIEWIKDSDSLSEFLPAMFGYQASISLEFTPEEFYWVTPDEIKRIAELFPARPEKLQNWLNCSITLYGEAGYRIALMDTGSEIQMNYAANSQAEFDRISALLADIGEAL